MKEELHLHVEWVGPYTYEAAEKLRDEYIDYGVYQIYGSHPVYGSDVLLYIGKADKQTLGFRLSQEFWGIYNKDSSNVAVYVGRLSGYEETPSDKIWSHHISLVERLLISAHCPAANSSGLNIEFGKDIHSVHVLNWGRFRDLLPEVSGARYSDKYYSDDGYSQYGQSQRPVSES
ncbi:hypothetical protein [Thalassolituus oleivorans]|uniref:hypothetical protein n=1 Tax=Thalassolituus oleivorans TaxID=187493 RepID=UPI0023F1CE96|nr:hypothetical protein [Thalassolituus oleivorans]